MNNIRTLCDAFFHGIAIDKPDRFLTKGKGATTYRPMSTSEFADRVRRTAATLTARGIGPGDRIALISYNRPEWAIVDYAALLIGAVTVPIYTTLPADQVEFILADSGAKLVFAENVEQLQKVGGRRAIVFDRAEGAEAFEDLLKTAPGKSMEELRQAASRIEPESLATLIYTSGTTGVPKGVMLTHANLTSNLAAISQVIQFSTNDVALSFLPLSHAFERLVDYVLFYQGTTIAYAESTDTVPQNVSEVRPSLMASVPRLYEKIYAKIMEGVRQQPAKKQAIFRWAVATGGLEAEYRRRGRKAPLGLRLKRWVAHRLVFKKVHARVGGRLRIFVSGGAPLSREIAEFFWAMGFTVLEGYGLTETSPVITCNREGATKLGSVGQVIPGVEVKIAEDGEVLSRGPHVMKGYYNRPEETAAVMKDGWFCTGDIGELDSEGFLKITDRKKELLKTSGGKYIAPQPIENKLKMQPGVVNAVVLGDRQRFASALIVSAPGATREQIQAAVDEVNKGLAPFESIKKFELLDKDFTIEGGELTPTMKVKRRVVEKKYADLIARIYAEDGVRVS
ncbi:MAG: long-chain fatty acid--CoA ligase [Planctomycetes bacterium]|nr:long-chain fatty acid--CoA ligase [Planctomycetota bacterium]